MILAFRVARVGDGRDLRRAFDGVVLAENGSKVGCGLRGGNVLNFDGDFLSSDRCKKLYVDGGDMFVSSLRCSGSAVLERCLSYEGCCETSIENSPSSDIEKDDRQHARLTLSHSKITPNTSSIFVPTNMLHRQSSLNNVQSHHS